MNTDNQSSLSFDPRSMQFKFLDDRAFSLPAWDEQGFKDDFITSIDLDDLPCRLEPKELIALLQKIYKVSAHGAVLKLRLPHPRHDSFLCDLGYVRPLLPVAFHQIIDRYGFRFDVREALVELDPVWQARMEKENLSVEEVEKMAWQMNNVVLAYHVEVGVIKMIWVNDSNPILTAPMRFEFQKSLTQFLEKGDTQSAEAIRRWLADCPIDRVHTVPPEMEKFRTVET